MSAIRFDLSGIGLEVDGLAHDLGERLAGEWRDFVVPGAGRPFLRLRVERAAGEASGDAPFAPKAMRARFAGARAVFEMPEGRAEAGLDGHATVALARAAGGRDYYALLNFVRACLAWTLPTRGAALLHAAGIVVAERGFVLVGSEGAGKSTWSRLAEVAGAHVVSDDLVLVDGAGAEARLLGAPFRSTHAVRFRRGRWPLAAVLFPVHGAAPRVEAASPLLARAKVVANLPFVAEALDRDERLAGLVEGLVRGVGCANLVFGLDPAFVGLLRRWPGR